MSQPTPPPLTKTEPGPVKQAIRPVVVSVVGCLILAVFFSMFMTLSTLLKTIPAFVAFNGALAGYNLFDRIRKTAVSSHRAAVAAGLVVGGFCYGLLAVLFFFATGSMILDWLDLIIYLGLAAIFAELGNLLARKYFRIRAGNRT